MRTISALALTLLIPACGPASDLLTGGVGSAGEPGGTATDEPGTLDPADPSTTATDLLPVILDCDTESGYEVDTEVFGTDGPALWLTGIYQTHDDHSGGYHPMGYGEVFFDLAGDNILALSSYEPVTWELTLGDEAEVTEILLFGYHEQLVEGADGIPVTYIDPYAAAGSVCGYSLPYNGGGCDTDELIAEVEAAAGRSVTRFDGCYDASVVQYDEPEPEAVEPSALGDVILDCAVDAGYQVDTWLGEAAEQGLWLASVYETHSNHGGGSHPMGEATVHFDLPGDHVLALASYEPVTWQLELGAQAGVTEIVVFGYHEQVVDGAGNIPITYVADPSCGYSWPYNGGGCDTTELVDAVEAETGRLLSRFDGCYRATDFQFVVP
jgi:hypothetical protein